MKILCGMIALASASVAVANNSASFPKDKVTEFVVEKLDVTTLPSGHTAETRSRKENVQ